MKDAAEIVRIKKRALLDAEQALEAKRAVKALSVSDLGEGRPKGGGNEGKEEPLGVAQRLLGQ